MNFLVMQTVQRQEFVPAWGGSPPTHFCPLCPLRAFPGWLTGGTGAEGTPKCDPVIGDALAILPALLPPRAPPQGWPEPGTVHPALPATEILIPFCGV